MKSVFLAVIFVLFSVNALGFSNGPIVTFPMVCRGGGSMGLIIAPTDSGTRIEVRFRKGSRAYNFDRSALEPGECTWLDRTLNASEPGRLWWNVDHVKIWTEFRAVGSSAVGIGVVNSAQNLEEQQAATFFLNTVRSGDYFTVNVFNTNSGYFQVFSIQQGS